MAVLQTPWYGKAVEALKLNGKGERTQEAYARHVRKLIEFVSGKEPDQITEVRWNSHAISFIARTSTNGSPTPCASVTAPSSLSTFMSCNATGICSRSLKRQRKNDFLPFCHGRKSTAF